MDAYIEGALLIILIIQGLFAWALWYLRRIFVRINDVELENVGFSSRLNVLERYVDNCIRIKKFNDIEINKELLRKNINTEKMLILNFGYIFIVEYYSADNSSVEKIEIRAEKYDRENFYANKEKNVINFYDKNYKNISVITNVINVKKIPYILFL